MKDLNSFFTTLMDSFMHRSKPIAVFPMASDTYLMTERDHLVEHKNDRHLQQDHREYYLD